MEIGKINSAINSLPQKTKVAFKLIREDNLKYKEVSEILGISVKTVEAHVTTAVRKLREALR
ncbi:sigma-70 family RNA polymerase sigma factor [Massilibacteroides vaginae]|uniref:sigma-70 family RNA polymerase sigma factor n=1 Tax=Massilibacteroides vaginae TaxID=1673718 RepID=UPI001FE2E55D|nr:sigma-70 family RNA polymerase sigma factor [Massilibacteroides vaginae]